MMYYNIYEIVPGGKIYIRTLSSLDYKKEYELYELKQLVTKIEAEFEQYKIDHPDKTYEMYVTFNKPTEKGV